MNKEKLDASLQNRTCIICNEKLGSYPYYLIKLNNIKGKTLGYICEDCGDDKSRKVKFYYTEKDLK